jgi:hypothetical protein
VHNAGARQPPDDWGLEIDPTVTGGDYRLAYELMHWSKGPDRRALPSTATTRTPIRGTLPDGLTRLARMAGVLATTDDLLSNLAAHLEGILTLALQSPAPVSLATPHEPPTPSRMSFMMDQVRCIGAFSSLDGDGGGAAEPMWRPEVFQAVLEFLLYLLSNGRSLEELYEDRPGELERLQAALELEMVERIKAVKVILEHTAAEAPSTKRGARAFTAPPASREGMDVASDEESSHSTAGGSEVTPANPDPREVPAGYVLQVRGFESERTLSDLKREKPEAVQHLSEGFQARTAAMGVELSPALTTTMLTGLLGLMEVCMRTLQMVDIGGSRDSSDDSDSSQSSDEDEQAESSASEDGSTGGAGSDSDASPAQDFAESDEGTRTPPEHCVRLINGREARAFVRTLGGGSPFGRMCMPDGVYGSFFREINAGSADVDTFYRDSYLRGHISLSSLGLMGWIRFFLYVLPFSAIMAG